MHIISGKYKGRNIKGFAIDGTRPTMDRVKESLFAIIQQDIKNANVLDLFAGSGNLAFESLSNGATSATLVDKNPKCIEIIKENIKTIKVEEKVNVINKDYKMAIKALNKEKFDIVFLDPPYHEDILNEAIREVINDDILNDNALLIVEYEEEPICDLPLIKEKKYGDKYIKIYQYKATNLTKC